MNRYDLVIYGASGFTGQYVVEFVYRAAKEHGMQSQGERGRRHWAVYYISPQSFKLRCIIRWLNNFEHF